MKKQIIITLVATLFIAFGFSYEAQAKVGNNELKAGRIINIQYSKNPESTVLEESADLITFNIDGNKYVVRDYAEDMEVNDWCLIMINTKGTKSVKDDIVLDWRAYVDYQDGEFIYEPIQK